MINIPEYVIVEKGDNKFYLRQGSLDVSILNENDYKNLEFTKDDVWLDIGAHIGTFVVEVAKKVKHVYAYEPYTPSFDVLIKNIELNELKNVTAYNLGLTNTDKIETFMYEAERSFHVNTTVKPIRGRNKIKIDLINIRDVIKRHPDINKIKLDGEGIEYEVIMGADFSNVNEIVYEYHLKYLNDQNGKKYYEMVEKLIGEGFEFLNFSEHKNFWGGVTIMHAKKS